ncbi:MULTISPECIES: hypothetical protein [unclassified Streptomyces]|uniref:hypothetical protein n=1 Tax=unclassified Streptomyces TaxID=2593676 RepID=UPI00093CE589|nr:hypothetical protein [Streptomyces sp. CB02058]
MPYLSAAGSGGEYRQIVREDGTTLAHRPGGETESRPVNAYVDFPIRRQTRLARTGASGSTPRIG